MKYEVTFSCGHTKTVEIFGSGKERELKLDYIHKYEICSDCQNDKLNRERNNDCREEKMLYAEYKKAYSHCTTKAGSYDYKIELPRLSLKPETWIRDRSHPH